LFSVPFSTIAKCPTKVNVKNWKNLTFFKSQVSSVPLLTKVPLIERASPKNSAASQHPHSKHLLILKGNLFLSVFFEIIDQQEPSFGEQVSGHFPPSFHRRFRKRVQVRLIRCLQEVQASVQSFSQANIHKYRFWANGPGCGTPPHPQQRKGCVPRREVWERVLKSRLNVHGRFNFFFSQSPKSCHHLSCHHTT